VKLIPLSMWAERRYTKPPSSRTLRRWAHAGNIIPRPRKEGRTLMVPENAVYVDYTDPEHERDLAELRESSPQ
jgi:hypothetical protein